MCYDRRMASVKRADAATERVRKLHIATRSTMYVVRTLLFLIMGCIVCIAAFLTAERVSNLYILTNEGMALRAECVLADGAENDLEEYFTLTYLERDALLSDTTYDSYTVSSYNYDLQIEKISVLPWSMSATVTAVERVSVKGTINASLLEEGDSVENYPVPAWTAERYRIDFVNSDGRWYINDLEALEDNPAEAVLGTPDPNRSPIPAATPTPAPTDAPAIPISSNRPEDVTTLG